MSRDSLTPCYFARPISAVELATALQLRVPKGAIKDSQDSKFQPIPFSEQKVLTQSVDSCATVSVVQENHFGLTVIVRTALSFSSVSSLSVSSQYG